MDVGGARDAGNLFHEAASDAIVCVRVAADDLEIDGRGKAKVDDLAGDVGGLEEKRHVGKVLTQALTELNLVIAGRAVSFLVERDQDFAIGGRNGGDIALRDDWPAIRNADVVDEHVNLIGRDY